MKSFQKCPLCGGKLIIKEVEKLLRGGNHTAVIKVMAEVCSHCGERLYQKETVERFEQIRLKLESEDIQEFKPIGKSYQIST
ncbi:YgiT-type zinc finger protein [candidate division KSB1 bacterium]|nr:YgiT-type zinc finger protein [candidate division KSB1 bacterium]